MSMIYDFYPSVLLDFFLNLAMLIFGVSGGLFLINRSLIRVWSCASLCKAVYLYLKAPFSFSVCNDSVKG